MIDREHDLPIKRQATLVGISRGTAYYRPEPVSEEGQCAHLEHRRIDVKRNDSSGSRSPPELPVRRLAEVEGVSQSVGARWFRHRGVMPLFTSTPVSERYLSFAERDEIALLRAQDIGVREIARRLGRSPSTVSRELTRNAAARGGKLDYRASVAQWKAELVTRRPKPAKLVTNPQLRHYVQDRLEGKLHDTQGKEVTGAQQAPFIGRNKPHRGDRKWVRGWSPEQIAHRLRIDFPDDPSMRISHEAVYQSLYIQNASW